MFGFNGQEKDNEKSGLGNTLVFEYRMYDARLGRFMSVDPLAADYPYYSTYSFAANRVIDKMELEGAEPIDPMIGFRIQLWWYDLTHAPQKMVGGLNTMSSATSGRGGFSHTDMSPHTERMVRTSQFSQGFHSFSDGAQTLGIATMDVMSLWGGDLVTDPVMAIYYGAKGDYINASLYLGASFIPAANGRFIKSSLGFLPSPRFNTHTGSRLLTNTVDNIPISGSRLGGFDPSDATVIQAAGDVIPKRGWYDVVIHGTEDGLGFVRNGVRISPEQLYSHMLNSGYQSGMNIRLLSCYSGSLEKGAAYQLSRLSNARVVAPRDYLFISNGLGFLPRGTMTVGGGKGFKLF